MSSLPSGYKQVEYIESSGEQYINTGFVPNSNTKVVVDYYSTATVGAVIGSDNSWLNSDFVIEVHFAAFAATIYNHATVPTGRHTATLDKGVFVFDGATLTTMSGTFTGTYALTLFALNRANSITEYGTLELYSCKIYDNGTLVRDFVPCYRTSDGEAGLYDLASAEFYTNVGSGEFEVGSEIKDPVKASGGILPFINAMRRRILMASGGGSIICNGIEYKKGSVLTITASTTVTVKGKVTAQVDVVAAGGGGGTDYSQNYTIPGGGGGSGGLSSDTLVLETGAYDIVVGVGGTAGYRTTGMGGGQIPTAATAGGNSSAFGLSATGGGPGGYKTSLSNPGVTAEAGGPGGYAGTGTTTNGNAGTAGYRAGLMTGTTYAGPGGASVYNGYGAGGKGGLNSSDPAVSGTSGVVVITIL